VRDGLLFFFCALLFYFYSDPTQIYMTVIIKTKHHVSKVLLEYGTPSQFYP